jgi:hypothetical protein
MKAVFVGTASIDRLREALRDPTGMRRFLNTRRKEASADEEARIWHALFRLYGIDEEWAPEIRLEMLAGRLAHELFPRCKGLWKPHGGGPSDRHQEKIRKRKLRLFKRFEAYCSNHPHLKSRLRSAEHFMREEKNKRACAAAGFTKPKSFSQAMREISSGTLG